MPNEEYLARQKAFWNVPTLEEARFARVDNRAPGSEAVWDALAEREIRHVFRDVTLPPDMTVLEMGCGVGRLLSRAPEYVPASTRLVGVDISDEMIRFARAATAHLPQVTLHVNDGARLAMLDDKSIAFAYSLHVFIHLQDTDVVRSYLREIARVLQPGGRFRFNIRRLDLWRAFSWSPGGILARVRYLTGRFSKPAPWRSGDPAEFSGVKWHARDLRREVEQAGLQVDYLGPLFEPEELWCDAVKPGKPIASASHRHNG